MKIFKIADNLEIVRGSKSAEPKYRKEISAKIIERFGRGLFSPEIVKEILFFARATTSANLRRFVKTRNPIHSIN